MCAFAWEPAKLAHVPLGAEDRERADAITIREVVAASAVAGSDEGGDGTPADFAPACGVSATCFDGNGAAHRQIVTRAPHDGQCVVVR